MGLLTAYLPNGLIHTWSVNSITNAQELMRLSRDKWRSFVENEMKQGKSYFGTTDLDKYFEALMYGMWQHIMRTPEQWIDPEQRRFREAFLTYFLLDNDTRDPEYPGKFYEYLPQHDIEFKMELNNDTDNYVLFSRIIPKTGSSQIEILTGGSKTYMG